MANKIKYVPMRLSYPVISRPGPKGEWWEVARFETAVAASNYCIHLRDRATNPKFECMFLTEPRP